MKKNIKKILSVILVIAMVGVIFIGCDTESVKSTAQKTSQDTKNAISAGANIIENQPAPTDLDYSLERYNIIRRAYWVNGQREKANSLQCEVEKPLGYIVLFSKAGAVVGNFIVDGKVSSLNSYLFPAQTDYDGSGDTVGSDYGASFSSSVYTVENPGIDGAYGQNVTGIFFFTTDGKYIEWTGDFLYSDIPFEVDKPVLNYKEGK
nr:MAG TPA: protein of unknown function DUF5016 [Caudoviricetes sp.]